jgi:hypothetical protein
MGEKPRFQIQFEYSTRFRGGHQSLEQVLLPAGEQGWELCSLVPNPPNPMGTDSGDRLIFKRRKVS